MAEALYNLYEAKSSLSSLNETALNETAFLPPQRHQPIEDILHRWGQTVPTETNCCG